MIGLLLNYKEQKEIEYLLKREMEEILLDVEDERIDDYVKTVMKEKYELLLSLYKRLTPPEDYYRYPSILKKG
ncbi:hypothetical protein [Salsuginibacillus kocurii]|uniref:hypothetical protein n=1 Tax=Salsuginibacillus kocurii TaxID=427078 RepID=UPI0003813F74|nr:hypothetical protein [Salsuginibacillus kocurii]